MITESKNDDDLVFAEIVNRHHDDVRRQALLSSLVKEEVRYNKKEKVKLKKLRTAIIVFLIFVTLLFGSKKVVYGLETKDIDLRVRYYYSIMNYSTDPGKSQTRIENFVGINHDSSKINDPIVSYESWNNENFLNYVVEASRYDDSLVEIRCALIAAYNVINDPFIEDQFNILLNRLKNNEEFINNSGLDLNKDNIWQVLGYEDRMDFQMNARKDTKDMLLENKRSNNGKRM